MDKELKEQLMRESAANAMYSALCMVKECMDSDNYKMSFDTLYENINIAINAANGIQLKSNISYSHRQHK